MADKSYVKVASILDGMMHEWFKYECNLIQLGTVPEEWSRVLTDDKPELLFVMSAWEGNAETWRRKIEDIHLTKDNSLKRLTDAFKKCNIPTVFWNIEDPYHFERFIEAAKLFDFVFTTDIDSIPRYKDVLKHENVHLLTFAAQPKINNPIDRSKNKLGRIAFGGTWYNIGHEDRKKDMEIVLKPALKYGVHIYDRKFNYTKSNYYKFPEIYRPNIIGSLSYDEMIEAYKKYDIFMNVNTIQNSPTMFANRVFELLACGTNVISGYSVGVEQTFPGLVMLSKTELDTRMHLEKLLNSSELRDRLSLLGQREVLGKHTYRHRMETVMVKAGISTKKGERPGVSVITCTVRPQNIDNIFNNYIKQSYKKKELIVVLNSTNTDIKEWEKRAQSFEDVRVFQLDGDRSLGESLNFGVEKSNFDYITKFDDDNYYAPEFIGDLMNAFTYADAEVIGKRSYLAYLEGSKVLALRFPDMENQYVEFVSGAALIIRKTVFERIKFSGTTIETVTQFLKDCVDKGIKLYSTDRFNFVYIRHTSFEEHTWRIDDEEFLRKCRIIIFSNDYKTHATV